MLLFLLSFVMALYRSEEAFIKTVNCKLAQETGAAFRCQLAGRQKETLH